MNQLESARVLREGVAKADESFFYLLQMSD